MRSLWTLINKFVAFIKHKHLTFLLLEAVSKDKVSLQPKLEELSPNYDVSTTKSDTCLHPTKAQIQEIKLR